MDTIPKHVFDKEYSTQWKREVEFLAEKGIDYVYAKRHYKYPVTKYKYTKTPELFLALTEFYKQVMIEEIHKKIGSIESYPIEDGYIKIPMKDLDEAEKALVENKD